MYRIKNLKIWLKSIELTKVIFLLVSQLSSDEKFGLISQIKRSVVPIPSDIAEEAGRNSQKELKHFSSIANGLAYEL